MPLLHSEDALCTPVPGPGMRFPQVSFHQHFQRLLSWGFLRVLLFFSILFTVPGTRERRLREAGLAGLGSSGSSAQGPWVRNFLF